MKGMENFNKENNKRMLKLNKIIRKELKDLDFVVILATTKLDLKKDLIYNSADTVANVSSLSPIKIIKTLEQNILRQVNEVQELGSVSGTPPKKVYKFETENDVDDELPELKNVI